MNTRSLLPARLLAAGLLAFAASAHSQVPANDDFANRQSVPAGTTVSVTGTTVDATQEAFEVTNAGSSPAGEGINETKTVWYDYVPPVSGLLNIDITRTTSHGLTYALLFEGATPDLAHLIDQGYLPSYSDGDGYSAPPLVHVVAGQKYTISIGNTNFPGAFTLALTLTPDLTPSVSLTAPHSQAVRSTGQKGEFLFTLSAPAASLTLSYQAAGNAVGGTDYKMLKGTVIVPAGATTANVKIKPLAGGSDVDGKPTKVKLTLETGDGYTVGSAGKATIKIYDQN